jgi:hypothetical protein
MTIYLNVNDANGTRHKHCGIQSVPEIGRYVPVSIPELLFVPEFHCDTYQNIYYIHLSFSVFSDDISLLCF